MVNIENLLARHRANVERAEALVAARSGAAFSPDAITPEHPLAKALGYEAALAIFDRPGARRAKLAAHRRSEVCRLSLNGHKVREIAAELGLHPNYVVQIRAALGVGRIR